MGVVIKPLTAPKHFRNGERIILKNKNDKWSEKSHAPKVPKIPFEVTPEILEQRNAIEQFITENRLHNVLSKIGPVAKEDFGKIMKPFVEDIAKDFAKEYDMAEYGKEFGKYCSRRAAEMIRENFIKIVNGEF